MLGKYFLWEHLVSGLLVTNPRPLAGRRCPAPCRLSRRAGAVPCSLDVKPEIPVDHHLPASFANLFGTSR